MRGVKGVLAVVLTKGDPPRRAKMIGSKIRVDGRGTGDVGDLPITRVRSSSRRTSTGTQWVATMSLAQTACGSVSSAGLHSRTAGNEGSIGSKVLMEGTPVQRKADWRTPGLQRRNPGQSVEFLGCDCRFGTHMSSRGYVPARCEGLPGYGPRQWLATGLDWWKARWRGYGTRCEPWVAWMTPQLLGGRMTRRRPSLEGGGGGGMVCSM